MFNEGISFQFNEVERTMGNPKKKMKKPPGRCSGQALIEYVVILAVFAAILLVAIPSFEDSVGTAYINTEDKVTTGESPTPTVPVTPTVPGTEEYTVTYNANGGTNAPALQIKQHNVNLNLSSELPVYSNHTFAGWSVSLSRANSHLIDYNPGDLYTENANLTLYASWTSQTVQYTLRFFANSPAGASASFPNAASPISRTKYHDIAATIITDVPVCEGYTFLGWNENSASTVATYQGGSPFYDNRNADFYAIWAPDSYKVTYHANGGTGTPPATAKYPAGSSVTVENAQLTRTGFQFVGWNTNSGSSSVEYQIGSTFSMPNHDMDLYAIYMPTEFPYNGTDGTDGSIQSFTAPVTGTYQIQLWGAKGGQSCSEGTVNPNRPSGGYTVLNVSLTKGQTIYFAVGGHGADNSFSRSKSAAAANPGGWNGGGNGFTDAAVDEGGNFSSTTREGSGGGGGATAAYTAVSGDGQLANYSGKTGSILGVAGGGAGANYTGTDGYGGGLSGGNGTLAGTQSSGYAFGKGESATGSRRIR